jgi:hypothetical protein
VLRVPAQQAAPVVRVGAPIDASNETKDTSRYSLEVQTVSGRAAAVEFRVRLDSVEVWHHDHCSGVFDREGLRCWLGQPHEPLVVDEVAFSLDRNVDQDGRVAISLPDVLVWTLSPSTLLCLRSKL